MNPTKLMHAAGCALLIASGVPGVSAVASAGDVTLTPSQDTTLYEFIDDPLSNGAGQHLFVGNNADSLSRRTLLQFDVAGAIPAGSIIDSVTLTLNVSQTISGPTDVSLHRVLGMWAEGSADAMGLEGGGAPAMIGDATWTHAVHDTVLWTTPGGDLDPLASASASVAGFGPYTWGSTDAMVADVQSWLDHAPTNFGWIMIGDESTGFTSKRFDSSDNPNARVRPMLVIEYTIPGPGAMALLGLGALAARRRR